MYSSLLRPLIAILLSVALVEATVSAKRFSIIVNAEAEEEYLEKVGNLEYQTYHIVKGKFHGGTTRDKGLEQTTFEDLFQSLYDTLEKRDMYPEPDKNKGDLLIMVSWGRTSLDANWGDLQGIMGASDMTSAAAADEASSGGNLVATGGGQNALMAPSQNSTPSSDSGAGQSMGTGSNSQRSKNLGLLGLEGKLRSKNLVGSSPDDRLWEALEEERYFVILNAFDYQYLLSKKELKQVWRVRYNTRAIGVGFNTAFESMNEAVAGVIGLDMDKISTVKGDTSGTISMGEVEMLEMSESEKREVSD